MPTRLFVPGGPVAAALIALAVLAGACTTSAGAEGPARVFPAPGSSTASPSTQITFRNTSVKSIGEVTVTGSRSGEHTGDLQAHSDGIGASFLPGEPFEPGETVTVTAGTDIAGVESRSYEFTVSKPAASTGIVRPTIMPEWQVGAQVIRSRSDLRPSTLTTKVSAGVSAGGVASGKLLLTPNGSPIGSGPLIMDEQGRTIWSLALPKNVSAADLKVQQYRGKPVLTWFEGVITSGRGDGEFHVLDQTYTEVATIKAGNGYTTDLHDMILTPEGTALVLVYASVEWDLTAAGGPADGIVHDNLIQEIDIETGLVLFEWHSLDHIPIEESVRDFPEEKEQGWDYFHINSVDREAEGRLLISARNTGALYQIDRRSGAVPWTLGGKNSDFTVPDEARFAYQHDARRLEDGTILLFDNASGSDDDGLESSGLQLKLDEKAKTIDLVRRFTHPDKIVASTRGSAQRLPNGNTLIGWGSQAFVTEYDPEGNIVFDGRLDPGVSYRWYRYEWTGRPAEKPRVSLSRGDGGAVTAWVSWNGDTATARWELLAGAAADALESVASAERTGFETEIAATTAAAFFAVRALDASGETLVTSEAISPA